MQKIQKIKEYVYIDTPNTFWDRKQHMVELLYEKDFNKRNIPTKARFIQMIEELLEIYKKEIQSLLDKRLIGFSKSPWSSVASYVYNQAKKERDVPGLVINYKPFNKVLQLKRYLIPNKKDLFGRIFDAKIFSKFDMKSDF